jgi:membrane-associated protease RseP (regulator of RpoE activity)
MVRLVAVVGVLSLAGLLGPPPVVGQSPTPAPVPVPVPVPAPVPAADPTLLGLRDLEIAEARSLIRSQLASKYFDPLESSFGLTLAEADDSLRSQLEIPEGLGVVVVAVKSGSLGEQSGLKSNDVLLAFGDQAALTVPRAREVLLKLGKGSVDVKLIRQGKQSRMSLVGPEHGFPPEAAEYWIGVPVSPVDPTLRSHLSALPEGAGLIVNDVVKASPAEASGVKVNDILVSMGGKPLKNADTLIEQIQAAEGKPVDLEVLRAGKSTTLKITPAKRAHPSPIRVLSRSPKDGVTVYRLDAPRAGSVEPQYFFEYLVPRVLPYPVPPTKPFDIHVEMPTPRGDEATARIEASLKELTAKVDELKKAIEALKR